MIIISAVSFHRMSMFNFNCIKDLIEKNETTKVWDIPSIKRIEAQKLDLYNLDELKTFECDSIRTSTSDEAIVNLLLEVRYMKSLIIF